MDKIAQTLSLRNIFSYDEGINKPIDYLKGINKNTLIKLSIVIIYANHNKETPFETISRFLSSNNDNIILDFHNRVRYYLFIKDPNAKNKNLKILNPESSLRLLDTILSIDENEAVSIESNKEIEIRLLKAYLLTNQNTDDKHVEIKNTISNYIENNNNVQKILLPMAFSQSEYVNSDLLISFCSQYFKSIELFSFLSKNNLTDFLLKDFYKKWNLDSWKNYIKEIAGISLPCIQHSIKQDSKHYQILIDKKNKNYTFGKNILDLLSQKDNIKSDEDFSRLKTYPLYKDCDNEDLYWVIYPLFLIDKLFYSLYFELNAINNSLGEELKIKEFKSFIGDEFSERIILYDVLLAIIKDTDCVHYSGKEIKNYYTNKIESEPDYYIRNKDDIFLFESKDNLYTASLKQSNNYSDIEKKLKENLYYKKGIRQIITNIKRVLTSDFLFDKKYINDNVTIYPILVFHNRQLDVSCMNNLINDWFTDELQLLLMSGFRINNIKPLTVISVDTLLFYQNYFTLDSFKELLDAYHKEILSPDINIFKNYEEFEKSTLQRMLPFSFFLQKKVVQDIGRLPIPEFIYRKEIFEV